MFHSSWAWHRHTQSTVCLGETSGTGPATGTVGDTVAESLVSFWDLCPCGASVSGVIVELVSVVSLYSWCQLCLCTASVSGVLVEPVSVVSLWS